MLPMGTFTMPATIIDSILVVSSPASWAICGSVLADSLMRSATKRAAV